MKGHGRICGAAGKELTKGEGNNLRAVRRGLRSGHRNISGCTKTAECGFEKFIAACGEMPSSGKG